MVFLIALILLFTLFLAIRIRNQNDKVIEQNEKVIALLEDIKNKE